MINQLSSSSVGKKIIMSITGIFLCLFLVVHLSGNFLLFKNDGGAAFNHYSEFMSTNIFIRIGEIILFIGILAHIIDALVLTIKNKQARPIQYFMTDPSANTAFTSRFMAITGLTVLIFLVIHLRTFMVEHRFYEAKETMFDSVKTAFENPYYSSLYIVAMVLLGFHLHHGFQSSFQSLGINHNKYTPLIKKLSLLFSIIIPFGFATMPAYFYFKQFIK
ncbi:MAG: succinate dehydrogenase cytochrome b subunit [Planctomycetes bacterium]|nr:succinate dehydrogenase cytochrome b subunit [Planctomycetota bacterium]